ncbi:alpha/beta-hydrolase [Lipomyces starkeyi]
MNDTSPKPYNETLIPLPGGRTLAYDSNGDPKSLTILIFFHGVFGVGNASNSNQVFSTKVFSSSHRHYRGGGVRHHVQLGRPTLKLCCPDQSSLSRRIRSFETIPAQIINGQLFKKFPLGRQIKGLMLLSPFSKPRLDPNFNSSLSLGNWLMAGSLSHYIPFLPRLISSAFKPKFAIPSTAEQMSIQTLFDRMGEKEKDEFQEYRKKRGLEEGQLEKEFAMNAWRSVQHTMQGFIDVNNVMYEDWGFHPNDIDAERLGRRVLIYAAKGDEIAPNAQAYRLSENYRNAELGMLNGGHIVGLTKIDEIWSNFLKDA